MPLTAIDLFAGGGGLTVGLKRGGFTVAAAVENDKHACATYRANHSEVRLLEQDIGGVAGADLLRLAPDRKVDLLAGCPPCQGYTSLNKSKKDDHRNALILHMSRLAEEVMPKAIMMENVPGLSKKGKDLFEEMKSKLVSLGYELGEGANVLEAANYGVPQRRRRLVLLAGLGFEVRLPEATHAKDGNGGLLPWRSVWDTIGARDDLGAPLTLMEAKQGGDLRKSVWHVVRVLSPQNLERMQKAVPGKSWSNIPEDLRPECHRGGYTGFTNVYGRMEWHQPSPTITAGCTTFSKGRFGHPEADRTISVREAALLQTFPDDYVFDVEYMHHVCNVIGNALPCDFAEALAWQCRNALIEQNRESSNQ